MNHHLELPYPNTRLSLFIHDLSTYDPTIVIGSLSTYRKQDLLLKMEGLCSDKYDSYLS